MQFVAKAKHVPFSPYKLRALADVVRGKDVGYALGWLSTYRVGRVVPIKKVIKSAVANAKDLKGIDYSDLFLKEIRIDEGRTFRYFKPGAMGRAAAQRRRFSHISVVLEQKTESTRN